MNDERKMGEPKTERLSSSKWLNMYSATDSRHFDGEELTLHHEIDQPAGDSDHFDNGFTGEEVRKFLRRRERRLRGPMDWRQR